MPTTGQVASGLRGFMIFAVWLHLEPAKHPPDYLKNSGAICAKPQTRAHASAAAPDTISVSSVVMRACRARL